MSLFEFISTTVGTELVKAGLSRPAVLTKVTPGARDPAHPTAATAPTTIDVKCEGFVANLTSYQIRGTLIANVTRVVKIYGSTLPSGVVPAPGDRILIEGIQGTIANDEAGKRAVQRDAAAAIYTCQLL